MLETHRRQNQHLFADMPSDELDALTRGTVRSEIMHGGRLKLPTLTEFTGRRAT